MNISYFSLLLSLAFSFYENFKLFLWRYCWFFVAKEKWYREEFDNLFKLNEIIQKEFENWTN